MLMRAQGIAVDAGRILTTWGGTHAIDLICRSFLKPGDAVLVEDPGYFLMFGRLREAGYRIVPVARRHDGIDLDQLEAACREHRPRLMFVQSVLHNPTGWGSSAANLHRVLVIAQAHGVLIAEDDVQAHFHPSANATRLASLSGLDGVIYYSSFCKAFSPALRMGYIAADPALLKPLMREKIYSVMTTAALNEFVLLELLSAGHWRKHLARLQQKLGTARNAATRQLREAGVLLEHPGAGLFVWGAVPSGVDVELLVKDAYRHKILLVHGAAFTANRRADPHIRFNVVFSQHTRLAEYLQPRLTALAGARALLQRATSA